jgi:hypothetical protein
MPELVPVNSRARLIGLVIPFRVKSPKTDIDLARKRYREASDG